MWHHSVGHTWYMRVVVDKLPVRGKYVDKQPCLQGSAANAIARDHIDISNGKGAAAISRSGRAVVPPRR